MVTQLVTIREYLSQFNGNEFVIALILFSWLLLSGAGTLCARVVDKSTSWVTPTGLFKTSVILGILSPLQILFIRAMRDCIFTAGGSVGFYPTFAFIFFTLTPYTLLLGYALPYSLFVLRKRYPHYTGSRIYIVDNIGDMAGGCLFSFVLVFLVTPLQALLIANLPLGVAAYRLCPADTDARFGRFLWLGVLLSMLTTAVILEKQTLKPNVGQLVHYRESRFGRIEIHRDHEQQTLFIEGTPVFSNQNTTIAEEAVHYAMTQTDTVKQVLLISIQSGILEELAKYNPRKVDYVELDPEVTSSLIAFDLLSPRPWLTVIHEDARAYLAHAQNRYDVIIVNLPEPETFQLNRFYTDRFFELARGRLSDGGILSFSMEGFDNYLADIQRQKLSSVYHTAASYFKHVLLLPGQRVFFLCGDTELTRAIPERLDQKHIQTAYVSYFFHGNLTPARIDALNRAVAPKTAINRDQNPYLMRIMFSQWFFKFSTSPALFFSILGLMILVYLVKLTKAQLILFSTGWVTMSCEILVIFAFQIFFGYIYLHIGLIVTVFLAGLLPGAYWAETLTKKYSPSRLIIRTDAIIIFLLAILFTIFYNGKDHVPAAVYILFGFILSLLCGLQFPLALAIAHDTPASITRLFSADLMGAAAGTLVTSTLLIPYLGIDGTVVVLITIKCFSFSLAGRSWKP